MAERLAVLFYSMAGWGTERVILNLLNAWHADGLGVDLVLAKGGGSNLDLAPSSTRVIELGATTPFQQIYQIAAYLHKEKPRVLLAFTAGFGNKALAARALIRAKTRIAVGLHFTFSINSRAGKDWKKRRLTPLAARCLFPYADHIIAVSEGVADDFAETVRLPRSRIEVIYNPVVSDTLIAQSKEPLEHRWFVPGGPPVLVAAGRLDYQKDYPTLLRAFSRLRKKRVPRLIILGQGVLKTQLEAQAQQLGIAADVDFHGFSDNPYAFFAHADLLVLSSAWEGFGNVLVEALACGTPVVATDCKSGPREIIQDETYGRLAPVGDDTALAETIEAMLNQGKKAEACRQRAEAFRDAPAARRYRDSLGV
jgi:glycosyltransferase involved in cell wall biosynthesis